MPPRLQQAGIFTRDAWQQFQDSNRARGLSPQTIGFYEVILRRLASLYPQLPARPQQIESFLGGLTCSPRSRLSYFVGLHAFYNWTAKRLKHPNPMTHIQPPRVPKKLPMTRSDPQLISLLQVPASRTAHALIALILDTGLRVSELLNLTWDDFSDHTVRVYGKAGEREVPISLQARSLLVGIGNAQKPFPFHRRWAYELIKRAHVLAGIHGSKKGPHVLRHSFGRAYITGGGDPFSLQRMMGHSRLDTTKIYVEMSTKDLEDQHSRFSPLKRLSRASGQLL